MVLVPNYLVRYMSLVTCDTFALPDGVSIFGVRAERLRAIEERLGLAILNHSPRDTHLTPK